MNRRIVVVSGGFDPLHSGHIALFQSARALGDKLIVAVNSDDWLARKKGQAFMPWAERANIIDGIECVDEVIDFDDTDNTAKSAIQKVLDFYQSDTIIFANGGDRNNANIPEMDITSPRLMFEFSIGGDDKKNSSSWILEEWKSPKTERAWGYYRILHEEGLRTKVKELVVNPGQRLSMQRHEHRSELWMVTRGTATVLVDDKHDANYGIYKTVLREHEHMFIPASAWHQLQNNTDEELRVVEIQYGTQCVESDIERK